MAIEVVDSTPHPSVVREKICTSCGVTLRYTPKDIVTSYSYDYTGYSYDYTGYWDYVYSIQCPRCGEKLGVKAP